VEGHSILESSVRNRRAAGASTTTAKRSTELPASVLEGRGSFGSEAFKLQLRAGDWVEVRSKEEILDTLDKNGRLEELPFMPQMFQYCGQRFQVFKRAHKTCDPIYSMAGRKLENAVHLELRCDGKAHGGCQVGCLLFWKDAWLKPLKDAGSAASPACVERLGKSSKPARCSEQDVIGATSRPDVSNGETYTRYVCQTTQLPEFTKPLSLWNPMQYVEDYLSGNVTLRDLLHGALYVGVGRKGVNRLPFLRHLHDRLQSLVGGPASPVRRGTIPLGHPTPTGTLDLEAGELVRVKSHADILATLNTHNLHRGLYFDVEMVPFCGGVYRVRSRVERFIDEKTGRIKSLKSPAVILEGVACASRFSKCRMFCPRGLHSWWREEWLERVEEKRPGRTDSVVGQSARPCSAKRNMAGVVN
jgi:hypothetical protein